MRIYTQKATPGLHGDKNRKLKKFHFAYAAKKGVIHEGVIHEKFLMRIYTQKAAPGLLKGKNRRFLKKFHFAFAAKNGVLHIRGLYIRHYSIRVD